MYLSSLVSNAVELISLQPHSAILHSSPSANSMVSKVCAARSDLNIRCGWGLYGANEHE